MECVVNDVYPGVNFTHEVYSPLQHTTQMCQGGNNTCVYSYTPAVGGNYTFMCSAQNTEYVDLRNRSSPVSIFVRGELGSEMYRRF